MRVRLLCRFKSVPSLLIRVSRVKYFFMPGSNFTWQTVLFHQTAEATGPRYSLDFDLLLPEDPHPGTERPSGNPKLTKPGVREGHMVRTPW